MDRVYALCAATFTVALSALLFMYGGHVTQVCALNVLLFAGISQFLAQERAVGFVFVSLGSAYVAIIFAIVGVFTFAF